MRSRALSFVFALVVSLVAASPAARAEPMFTSFDDVVATSTDVVVATWQGPVGGGPPHEASHYELRVERALRGQLHGTIRVTPGDGHPHFQAGTRLVAFLRNGSFRFVGLATEGQRLEDGAIHLSGFYDFDAHIVSPGMTTLSALCARLAGRPSIVRYRGPLLALSDDGQRRISTPWTVDVTLEDGRAPVVTGLPVRGFDAPSVGQGGIFGQLTIDYRGSYPRPLRIEGRALGRDGDAVRMEFWVVEPDVFRVADLRRYFTDPSVDWVHYELRAVLDDGTVWADGPNGFDYPSISWFGHVGARSYSLRDTPRRWVHPRFTAELDAARPGASLDTYGDDRVVIQELLRGPLGFRIVEGEGAGRRGRIELIEVQLRSATP